MILLKNIAHSLEHVFFPHICAGCGTDILDASQLICLHCMERLPQTRFHMHANNPVEKIFWGRLPLASVSSHYYFSKDSLLQHLMHEFKYNGKKELGEFFGRQMGNSFLQSNRFRFIDALVPLPLFRRKERIRGYNQATVLCDGIATAMNLPVLKKVIRRNEHTETQTHKGRIERWKNMEGKFSIIDEKAIENRHILLVDDVITTGATLEACGIELLKAAGVQLSIATLAYTSN